MSVARGPSNTDATDFRQDTKGHATSPSPGQGMESASNYILKSRSKDNSVSTTYQRQDQSFPPTGIAPAASMPRSSQKERWTEFDVNLLKGLADDFGDLLSRRELSDCFLCVRGTYMAVHGCVLAARSQAFAAVLTRNGNGLNTETSQSLETTTENDKLVILIDKTDPETMKEVIIFMYTAKCDLDEHNAQKILEAAGRYDIKSLKVYTAFFLTNHIDTNSVLKLLATAYRYKNLMLRQHCIGYFLKHSKEIMHMHQTWKAFADGQPTIVAELLYWSVHPQDFAEEKPSPVYVSDW